MAQGRPGRSTVLRQQLYFAGRSRNYFKHAAIFFGQALRSRLTSCKAMRRQSDKEHLTISRLATVVTHNVGGNGPPKISHKRRAIIGRTVAPSFRRKTKRSGRCVPFLLGCN